MHDGSLKGLLTGSLGGVREGTRQHCEGRAAVRALVCDPPYLRVMDRMLTYAACEVSLDYLTTLREGARSCSDDELNVGDKVREGSI